MTTPCFPLVLSCGHKALDECKCGLGLDEDSPIDRVLRSWQGAWRNTLESYGCHLPSGRHHGPCPICGGKDRFRFDDKDGRGTWFCSQCEPHSGGGLILLSRFLGKSTIDTARTLLGQPADQKPIAKPRQATDRNKLRDMQIKSATKGAESITSKAIMAQHPYMTDRGLNGLFMTNGEPLASGSEILPSGKLLLVPAYKNGVLVNVQKISHDKVKKPLFGGDMTGVYHPIDGKTNMIAVTEGFATGVSVNLITGAMVYCAFNTGNLDVVTAWVKEQHPDSRIVIFADNDPLDEHHNRHPGEHFARIAAEKHGATIALPPEPGDWDDFRQRHGHDATKEAMRIAVLAGRGITKPEPKPEPEQFIEGGVNFGGINDFSFMIPTSSPQKQPEKGSEREPSEHDLPPGISFDGIDIDHPPGLAGELVDYMRATASRQLHGGAYTAMALQCIAMAGAGLRGLNGVKLSLITITLGLSASGKEHPQRVIKDILSHHGIAIYGDIRSDKDIIKAAVYEQGRCFYVIDEAHRVISKKETNKTMANVVDVLMEMATTSNFNLSLLHKEDFLEKADAAKKKVQDRTKALGDDLKKCNKELETAKIKKLEMDIAYQEKRIEAFDRRINSIMNGIKNPSLNLLAYSTPQNFASVIDESAIGSGFLGRGLLFDCGEDVDDLVLRWDDEEHEDLSATLEMLKHKVGMIYQIANENSEQSIENEFNGVRPTFKPGHGVKDMINNITAHYDQTHFKLHPRLGPMYRRISERVISVSSHLAMGGTFVDGCFVVEKVHVLMALLIALKGKDCVASNLKINESIDSGGVEADQIAVDELLIRLLTVRPNDKEGGWRYQSKIEDDLKKRKPYRQASDRLAGSGQTPLSIAIAKLGGQIEFSGKKIRLKPTN